MNKDEIVIGKVQIKTVTYDLDNHDFAKALNWVHTKNGNLGLGIIGIGMAAIGIYGILSPFI